MTAGVRVRAALLGLLLVAAGCSAVPSGGSVEVVRSIQAPQNSAQPPAPQSGQAPDQVIRGFIAASANNSFDQSQGQPFASARAFLTAAAAAAWRPTQLRIVVVRDEYLLNPDQDSPERYRLTGTQVGVLATDRSFRSQLQPISDISISVVQEDGQWRIDAPPGALVITDSDFAANFVPRTVWFLNAAETALVPDLRYLPRSSSQAARADRLVNMLLAGPSQDLRGAVRSVITGSAALASNVVIDGSGVVQVDLSGVDVPTERDRQALAAQLVWTVGDEGRGAAISVNGAPLDPAAPDQVFTTDGSASFDPDTVPATGQTTAQDSYYLDTADRIVSLTTGSALWGEWGTRGGVRAAAMSAATARVAAVVSAPDGSKTVQLRIGSPLERQAPETTVLTAAQLTAPSWDRFGSEVWVVQQVSGAPEVIRLSIAAQGQQVVQQVVAADGLDRLGPVTALQLSPDGVRVAVIAGGALYLGTITRTSTGGTTRTSIGGLHEIDQDLSDVGAVTWRSATEVLVAAKIEGSVFRVPVISSLDGRDITPLSTAGMFDNVTAVAIDETDTYVAFSGRVWKLVGPLTTGTWSSPDPQSPALYGSSPFLPN